MSFTKRSIAAELLRRAAPPVAQFSPITLDPRFPLQNDFIQDSSRFIAAQCSRRAGKTSALGLKFIKTMERHPGTQSLYLAMTRESAKNIMWPVLEELNERFKIGLTLIPTRLMAIHPNGAKLLLLGADARAFIKRIKGQKFPGVAVDEAQDFGGHLQSLVDDVLTPCIADYEDGWLALTGTPGPVPQGYFFEITKENKHGYGVHRWTLLENPYMPNPGAFIADLIQRRQWDDNQPTLLREYRNMWVLDVESLWIKYNEKLNHYPERPKLPLNFKWNYILGIDIGHKDADALAVLAWSEAVPETYLVEEVVKPKQDLTDLADAITAMQKKYDISKMVMDEGALGKKIGEEFRRRKHLPVHPADKARKQENVGFLNDAMRRGHFKAKSASRFAQDSYLVQIDWEKTTPDKIVIKKKPHSDIIDAVLYAFKESPAFTYIAAKPKPKRGSKEWADAQEDDMWESAKQHFEEAAEAERRAQNLGIPED